ncbi:MAG: 3-dehydroquinate synthase, partial [Peptococcales bacterium]
ALVVALGGGVIGDLAGFVASIYQRGIDLIHLPTTLLAQVDSSIGGKVAVNHPLGKNMIGSFYQPLGVWADLSCLKTLPEREWQAGLAEVIKYGVIWDEGFFDFLAENALLLKRRDIDCAREVIFRSCQIKAAIVEQDEQEQGLRTLLNFGHTFGHALEKVTKYQVYRHGEAVAIGMSMASKLAVYLNLCEETVIEKLLFILGRIGLPVSMPEFVALEDILTSLNLDKKIRKKELVFVLPRSIGKVEIVKGIGIESIRNCFIKKG